MSTQNSSHLFLVVIEVRPPPSLKPVAVYKPVAVGMSILAPLERPFTFHTHVAFSNPTAFLLLFPSLCKVTELSLYKSTIFFLLGI